MIDKYLFVYYLITQWDWKIVHVIAESQDNAKHIMISKDIHPTHSNKFDEPVYKIRVSCKEKSGLVHLIEIDNDAYEG